MDKDTIPIKDVVKKVISKISEDEDGPRIKKEDMQSAWECVVGGRVALVAVILRRNDICVDAFGIA